MTNAQNSVTMTARSHLSIGLRAADATRSAAGFWRQVAGMVMSYAITPVATWTQVNREMAELGRMDGRELRDMGVSSCDFDAIRQGTFERSSMLSAERIVFNPESTGEREADAERERMDFFVPFTPDPNWYCKWWLGD